MHRKKLNITLTLLIVTLLLFLGFLGVVIYGVYQATQVSEDLVTAIEVINSLPAEIDSIISEFKAVIIENCKSDYNLTLST